MSTRTTERIAGAAVVAAILLLTLAFVALVLGWVYSQKPSTGSPSPPSGSGPPTQMSSSPSGPASNWRPTAAER